GQRFDGRKAIITGGAAGIGLAIARRMADEGASVMIWDRDPAAIEAASADGRLQAIKLDITDPDAVARAANDSAERLGGISILVCSAGITGPNASVADYPIDAWKSVFDVNVHGLFYANRACVPHMIAGGHGRIVNIASVA